MIFESHVLYKQTLSGGQREADTVQTTSESLTLAKTKSVHLAADTDHLALPQTPPHLSPPPPPPDCLLTVLVLIHVF